MDWANIRAVVGKWADRLTLPEKWIFPIMTFMWGAGNTLYPDLKNIELTLLRGRAHDASLYYNGIVFIRVMLPFFVGIHIRWSGHPDSKKQYLQTHIGWKKNGDFAVTFRIQNDTSSAAGTYGRNFNQAKGWSVGTH